MDERIRESRLVRFQELAREWRELGKNIGRATVRDENLAGFEIGDRSALIHLFEETEEIVAHPQVQRKFGIHLPAVLEKCAISGAGFPPARLADRNISG